MPEEVTGFSDPMSLIFAEEFRQNTRSEDKKEVVVIEEKNITRDGVFYPKDSREENPIQSLPVHGEGELDLLIVRSNSQNFSLEVSVDDTDIIDDMTYTELNNLAPDLSHISAYDTADGEFVVTVTDYPFYEIVRARIRANDEITFPLIRVELFMDRIDVQEEKDEFVSL